MEVSGQLYSPAVFPEKVVSAITFIFHHSQLSIVECLGDSVNTTKENAERLVGILV
jgi:hypothetical protein